MSAHRMTFPPVPGKTPREQFENLARMMLAGPITETTPKPRKRKARKRKRVATAAVLLLLLLFGGCLSGARKHVAPDTWVNDSGASATQADVDRCKDLSGLKWASLDTLDAKLGLFDGCMRDRGFKMQ
jgi:hypothetical protein